MNICKIHPVLAYLALIYIITSVYYLIVTRKLGTPFADALKKYPELQKIKKKSANDRGNAFYTGLLISCIIVFILQPFSNC